jgi:predicted transcriptional regulator
MTTIKKHVEKTDKESIEQPIAPIGLEDLTYPVLVRNKYESAIALESGIIKPGEEGLATYAECGCLLIQYLEIV